MVSVLQDVRKLKKDAGKNLESIKKPVPGQLKEDTDLPDHLILRTSRGEYPYISWNIFPKVL